MSAGQLGRRQPIERVLHPAGEGQPGQALLFGGGQHRALRRRRASAEAHVYVTAGPPRRNDGCAATAHLRETMRADQAYDELMRRVREESLLTTVEALLEWDEETYMPPGGVENRSEQLALVAGLLHDRGTDPRLGELLAARRGLRPAGRSRPRRPRSTSASSAASTTGSCRLPRTLVEDVARTTALAQKAWADARAAAGLRRGSGPGSSGSSRSSARKPSASGYADEPYDALLEDYEPGLRSAVVARLFDALRRELVPLAGRIAGAPAPAGRVGAAPPFPARPPAPLRRDASPPRSGFDFGRGRMDLGVHPSCTGIGRGRLPDRASGSTSATSPAALFTILHEVGHGLYEQGLDPGALRHAAGRGGLGGHGRGAGAALGEPGRPRPAVLGALLPPGARALSREPGRRAAGRVPLRGQPGGAVADPGARPTR